MEDRFAVEVENGEHWGMRSWELKITHNGRQWNTTELYSIEEIEKVIKALQKSIGGYIDSSK